jgi:D-alanine-D-alanine ligase
MKIVALIDPETLPEDDPQLEGKNPETRKQVEFHVVESLRLQQYEVQVFAFDANIERSVRVLTESRPDLVFNLTEHVGGDRRKDMHVVALLELLGIPFTGTESTGLMLCRDKAMCKRLLSHHRVKIPDFVTLPVGKTKPTRKLTYPLIVKPMSEDGSDGISLASLVQNDTELEQRVRSIHERMQQPVICEEYIEGREIYVSIVGNKQLRALPAREVRFGRTGEGGPTFATAMVKHNDAYRKKWGITYGHARLTDELQNRAAHFSKRVYRLLQIRDYGRIDLRVTPENEIVFLEANANPDLSLGDELAESWEKVGKDYQDLIKTIVNLALRRIGR